MPRRRMIKSASKARYVSPNRGLALLNEAIEQIELQEAAGIKSEWNQGEWRCGTGMCLAGWIAQLAGGKWLTEAIAPDYEDDPNDARDYLQPLKGELPEEIRWFGEALEGTHVQNRACSLIGLDEDYADSYELFAPGNQVSDIRQIRDEWASEGILA